MWKPGGCPFVSEWSVEERVFFFLFEAEDEEEDEELRVSWCAGTTVVEPRFSRC